MAARGKNPYLFKDMSGIDLGSFEQISGGPKKRDIFLGELTKDDLRLLMKRSGLTERLSQKGFDNLTLSVFTDDNDVDHLGIFSVQGALLIDLRLSKKRFVWGFDNHESAYDMIVIEWLSTRNPNRTAFTTERPQLPGQAHPSLGCLRQLLRMMVLFSRKIQCDGFLDIPDHLHLSVMYSSSFFFADPRHEGTLRALLASLKNESLYTIAWASVTGAIIDDETHEPYRYTPSEQLYPVSSRLKAYFASAGYRNKVKQGKTALYRIDLTKLEEEKRLLLEKNNPADL